MSQNPNPQVAADLAALDDLEMRLFARSYASSAINYAGETDGPPKGAEARGEVLALFGAEAQEMLCSKETGELLDRLAAAAEAGELDEMRSAQVRVMRRDRSQLMDVPVDEAADFARLVNEASEVWRRVKNANDWDGFEPYLTRIVDTMQRFAGYKDASRDPYDVWLDEFETGSSRAFYDSFFDEVKACVVPLVAAVVEKGWQPSRACIEGTFAHDAQMAFTHDLLEVEGLDKDALVVGEVEHPFSDSLASSHVFVTTHVHEDDVVSSLYSVLHEGGHALYEQGSAPELDYTSLGGGTSMGIHESQSRFFENIIGRSEEFAPVLLRLLEKHFPGRFADVDPHDFFLAVNRAEPSLIRTEADELTYPLHVIIRYELEQLLFSGEAKASDIPRLWAEKYRSYLGIEVPDHARGALQDVHWSGGMIGYFPTYALGGAYGAQFLDAMIADGVDFSGTVSAGDLAPVRAWLGEKIWRHGRSKDPDEIVLAATGSPLDASHFTRYLERKFSAIYGL